MKGTLYNSFQNDINTIVLTVPCHGGINYNQESLLILFASVVSNNSAGGLACGNLGAGSLVQLEQLVQMVVWYRWNSSLVFSYIASYRVTYVNMRVI